MRRQNALNVSLRRLKHSLLALFLFCGICYGYTDTVNQGSAGDDPWVVDGSGVTQPVSGTVTCTPSGTQTVAISQTTTDNNVDCNVTNGSIPVTGTFWQSTQPVSGTFWQTTQPVSLSSLPALASGSNTIGGIYPVPQTSGGLTTYHLVSAASTNATVVKNSAGQLYGWYIYNSNAAARKVAFHNASSTPTAGASIYFTLVIPPSGGANVFSETGIPFSTGISITTVTDLADSGTTAVAANDLIINLWYK